MRPQRAKIALILLPIALAGVVGVSYVHPFHTIISPHDDDLIHVTISDGNLRIVALSAKFIASYSGETPLNEYAQRWNPVPTKALAWDASDLVLTDETSIEGIRIHEFVVSCTLFAPLVAVVFLVFVVRPVFQQRRLLGPILRECVRPSNRESVRSINNPAFPVRRWIRRSALVVFALGAVLMPGVWAISYTGLHMDLNRRLLKNTPWLSSRNKYAAFVLGRRLFAYSSLEIWAHDGLLEFSYTSPLATGITVATQEFEMGGFRWQQGARPTIRFCGTGMLTPTPAKLGALGTTNELASILQVPCWFIFILVSGWPAVAFVRGPYRRARRLADGCCLKCGYNLTGLVDPRCPECGTPLPPHQHLIPPPPVA